nr:MAG TPA: hypothetical protein [Caudoviricetes sp.]
MQRCKRTAKKKANDFRAGCHIGRQSRDTDSGRLCAGD